ETVATREHVIAACDLSLLVEGAGTDWDGVTSTLFVAVLAKAAGARRIGITTRRRGAIAGILGRNTHVVGGVVGLANVACRRGDAGIYERPKRLTRAHAFVLSAAVARGARVDAVGVTRLRRCALAAHHTCAGFI